GSYQYQLSEGSPRSELHLDRTSLKPDLDAKTNDPAGGARSFASQIFAVTAANLVNTTAEGYVFKNFPDKREDALIDTKSQRVV
ncbi:hypothetical protein ABTO90_20140, partial [Acinetobacter baumannii]